LVQCIGFFEYFEHLGSSREWQNVIRWLFSTTGITKTESIEKIAGKQLACCDYTLAHPELEDQAMMLYTAMTRARGSLYFIEIDGSDSKTKSANLADFAFRQFKQLRLLKIVQNIDEGEAVMTPQQHKVRGVLLVVQAINMSRNHDSTSKVISKFEEAAERFQPDKGNDRELLEQCKKHLRAFRLQRALMESMKSTFFDKAAGDWDLRGKLKHVLDFENKVAEFVRLCANDSFLVDEIQETRVRIEDCFYGTPYELHFSAVCSKMREFENLSYDKKGAGRHT